MTLAGSAPVTPKSSAVARPHAAATAAGEAMLHGGGTVSAGSDPRADGAATTYQTSPSTVVPERKVVH